MGFDVSLVFPAKRIVSLVPSQTELLYYLGVDPVGQTIFCVHPQEAFKNSTKVGGTKKLNVKAIKALKPDLIIGNKEENVQWEIELLRNEFPVWMSDVNSVEDALSMIQSVGELTGKSSEATNLTNQISNEFKRLLNLNIKKKSALYLIWYEPFMAVANQTFIHEMLKYSGFENVLKDATRYPELSKEDIENLCPKYILLSTEPYPFKQKHVNQLAELFPTSKVILVDGEMFSWYGNRMLKAADYISKLKSDNLF